MHPACMHASLIFQFLNCLHTCAIIYSLISSILIRLQQCVYYGVNNTNINIRIFIYKSYACAHEKLGIKWKLWSSLLCLENFKQKL